MKHNLDNKNQLFSLFCLCSTGEEMDYPRERERYENSAHYVRSASQWGDSGAPLPEGYLGKIWINI
jgi:hypothetical protein